MKKYQIISATYIFCAIIAMYLYGCKASQAVADKSGATLWSENCQRCHNSPPRSAYSNIQWDVVNTHMRQRAILTEDEYKKINEFFMQ